MSKTTFFQISKVFDVLEQTPSRNEITQILSDLYKTLSKESSNTFYLILGRVAPSL